MRPSRRLHFQFQATLLAICFVVCPHVICAQNPAQLPPQWNDAVSQLADKIAANVSPLQPLSLETKNISSLGSADVANVRAALESQLKARSFRLIAADSPPAAQPIAKVQFTFSEGAQGYVFVAEIQTPSEPDSQPQIAIVAAPKTTPGTDQQSNESLSLDKRLIWQQPTKFLDFATAMGTPGLFYSTAVILEPERLVSYRSDGSQWQPGQAISITHAKPWPRDLVGTINVEAKVVSLPDLQCAGDVFSLEKVHCVPFQMIIGPRVPVDIPGHKGSDYVGLFAQCGNGSVVFATGTGDWTQPDSIQGYLNKDWKTPAVPAGAAIEFDGPVVALWREGRESAARAIVHNLKTGNYEGYIVTATCSH